MKSNVKSKTMILITLGILFAISPLINNNFNSEWEVSDLSSHNRNEINSENEDLKISAVSGKIHIINNSGWLDFRNAGYCTGNGTYSEPYVIEDLIIDGGGSGSCILIENSNVYFTIQNCTLFNSGHSEWYIAGIRLNNVSNGKIINNNCSFNRNGIYTYFSKNNTISTNIAKNNTYHGICVAAQSNETVIDGNTACFNSYIGIHIDGGYTYHNSYNNLIINNNASYNAAEGIRVTFTNDTKIINNTAINNGYDGWGGNALNIQLCQNITISKNNLQGGGEAVYAYWLNSINFYNNTISSSRGSGLNIEYSNDVNLVNNIFAENNIGISLHGGYYLDDFQGVENCVISENIFIDCSFSGIYISDIFNLTIIGNNFINCGILIGGSASLYHATSHSIGLGNLVNGKPIYYYVNQTNLEINNDWNIGQILLVNCNQSTLSNLIISSGSVGISLLYSYDNIISACILNHHTWGLNLALSHSNTISGVTLNYNMIAIELRESNFTTIKENRVLANDFGMFLSKSDNNQISGNFINNNLRFGIYLDYSKFNLIKANTINSNDIGIYLFGHHMSRASNNNTVIDNILIGNNLCFFEGDDCTGNIFKNNYCAEAPLKGTGRIPFELIILISIISGGAVIGVATLLLLIRKRRRIE